MAFRIDPDVPLEAEFGRLVAAGCDAVSKHLDAASHGDAGALHEARKALKRMRALLRLVRNATPEAIRAQEQAFRDAARLVSAPRDATAAIETVDRFVLAYPLRLVDARLGDIRAILVRRRDRIARENLAPAIEAAAAFCHEAETALGAVRFETSVDDGEILGHGMKKTLARWERALDAARDGGDAEAFHDLRKAVKAHGAQLALLRDWLPEGLARRREATDALGEMLGELNDIHVMRAAIADGQLGERKVLQAFDELLQSHAPKLQRPVLTAAARLHANRPRRLADRLRATHARAA